MNDIKFGYKELMGALIRTKDDDPLFWAIKK